MRRCLLVSYDIRNPKRLRRVFKIMKGYGEHWQLSVFFCVLDETDRVRMQNNLESEINQKEDQAMILDLGSNEEEARETVTVIGQSLPKEERGMVVI